MELLVAAALLGATHAVEPDHVAGITGLAGDAGRGRAALVGAAFGAGHALLVLAWVLAGALVLDALPAVDVLETAGRVALGVALVGVGAATTLSAWRSSGRNEERVAAPGLLTATRPTHPREYLGVGAVGAAFTLSPPLSMLVFVTGLLPRGSVAAAAVGVYAAVIVAAMAGVGFVVGSAFDALDGADERLHRGGRLLAGVVVAAFGVSVLL